MTSDSQAGEVDNMFTKVDTTYMYVYMHTIYACVYNTVIIIEVSSLCLHTFIHSRDSIHARRWTALIHSSHIAYLPA